MRARVGCVRCRLSRVSDYDLRSQVREAVCPRIPLRFFVGLLALSAAIWVLWLPEPDSSSGAVSESVADFKEAEHVPSRRDVRSGDEVGQALLDQRTQCIDIVRGVRRVRPVDPAGRRSGHLVQTASECDHDVG